MKKSLAKVLIIALCAVLLVSGTVFVTLAYLQMQSNVVINTFSASGIYITLDEAKMGADGKVVEGVRIPNATDNSCGNNYHLVPGGTYTKDPIVHVQPNSEPCYVYIAIRNTLSPNNPHDGKEEGEVDYLETNDEEGYKSISKQLEESGWVALNTTLNDATLEAINAARPAEAMAGTWTNANVTIYCYMGEKSAEGVVTVAGEEAVDLDTFKSFTVDSDIEGIKVQNEEGTEKYVIEVVAFAVQSEGWKSEAKTLEAFQATYGTK